MQRSRNFFTQLLGASQTKFFNLLQDIFKYIKGIKFLSALFATKTSLKVDLSLVNFKLDKAQGIFFPLLANILLSKEHVGYLLKQKITLNNESRNITKEDLNPFRSLRSCETGLYLKGHSPLEETSLLITQIIQFLANNKDLPPLDLYTSTSINKYLTELSKDRIMVEHKHKYSIDIKYPLSVMDVFMQKIFLLAGAAVVLIGALNMSLIPITLLGKLFAYTASFGAITAMFSGKTFNATPKVLRLSWTISRLYEVIKGAIFKRRIIRNKVLKLSSKDLGTVLLYLGITLSIAANIYKNLFYKSLLGITGILLAPASCLTWIIGCIPAFHAAETLLEMSAETKFDLSVSNTDALSFSAKRGEGINFTSTSLQVPATPFVHPMRTGDGNPVWPTSYSAASSVAIAPGSPPVLFGQIIPKNSSSVKSKDYAECADPCSEPSPALVVFYHLGCINKKNNL